MNQNLIYFQPGCYGTFFEWVLNFLEGTTDILPFDTVGSSHNFDGNFLWPSQMVLEHVKAGKKYRYSRCHPVIFEKTNEMEEIYNQSFDLVIQKDLDFLKKYFNKILVVTFDKMSMLWKTDNMLLDKGSLVIQENKDRWKKYKISEKVIQANTNPNPIERIKLEIKRMIESPRHSLNNENLLGWGEHNIDDFDIWQLREFLSLFYVENMESESNCWKIIETNNPDILFIYIDSLRENFNDTILQISTYFNIEVTDIKRNKLIEVYKIWKTLQKQIDKDLLCDKIVQSILLGKNFDWSNYQLSIIDEAWVQKKLRDNNMDIKCYNLNVFPTNTETLREKL